jgi:hypothetical protein
MNETFTLEMKEACDKINARMQKLEYKRALTEARIYNARRFMRLAKEYMDLAENEMKKDAMPGEAHP